MPSWLLALLAVLGIVAVVGLEAAAVTGRWRTWWVAVRHFGGALLVLAVLGAALAWFMVMSRS